MAALKASTDFNKIVAFDSSPAQDKNGFVVTKETADKYSLVKLSDLANAAVLTCRSVRPARASPICVHVVG